MSKVIAIDPGRCKCGLVLVDINIKKVQLAVVLESDSLAEYIKELKDFEFISKILIGNGTTCEENIKKLAFFKKDLIFLLIAIIKLPLKFHLINLLFIIVILKIM